VQLLFNNDIEGAFIMTELDKYIPADKHDTVKIYQLSKFGYPYYKPILKELFVWIQDMNWPVARVIAPLLIKAGKDIVPEMKNILLTNDDAWKYWSLTQVVRQMPDLIQKEIVTEILPELQRIALNPTESEVVEELDIIAKEILKKNLLVKKN